MEEEYKGYTIKVELDLGPEDPREWDNLGILACWHKRHNLGDVDERPDISEASDWEEVEEIIAREGGVCILPVYLYDHGVLRMKVGSFHGLLPGYHAAFDSGQVGYIYTTKERIREWFGMERVSKKALKRAEGILRGEIKAYDDYLSGNVWGFAIHDEEGEEIDSCWGFYGDPNEKWGAMAEAKRIVDGLRREGRTHAE